MPQSPTAALSVWSTSHIDPSKLQNVAAAGPATLLPWLGDVFGEPRWLPRANVVSLGDVLLAIAVAAWAFGATTSNLAVPWRTRRRIVALLGAPIHGAAPSPRRRST
jgi:hypothetical protein